MAHDSIVDPCHLVVECRGYDGLWGVFAEELYQAVVDRNSRMGCCGVLVWLVIAAVFATFFIMEYLERPAQQKSFWKAGVTVN